MKITGIARRVGVDAAVFFSIITKAWQIVHALVTIVLIAHYLAPETQGYFFTFGSLLGLQAFFELAFYLVIINAASHEWAHLRIDDQGRIAGDPDARSRLASLARLGLKWYAVGSLLFLIGTSTAGWLFFSKAPIPGVNWQAPWIALVCSTAVLMFTVSFTSILEGCNQVATIQRFRFFQVVLGSLALWGAFAMDLGLWALVAVSVVTVGRDAILIFGQYRNFFRSLVEPSDGPRIDWREDIWPMQWRLAISGSGIVGFLALSMLNPVMFHYHGAVVAGQMGMTWAMAQGVQMMALAWIYARVPVFGQMIARRDWPALDYLWWRVSTISVVVAMLGGTAALVLVYSINVLGLSVAHRLLPLLPTAVLMLAVVFVQVAQCLTAYLRAHKKEPTVWMSFTCSLLVGVGVWQFGARYGPLGATCAYLTVTILTVIWETSIWRRCRAAWHV